MSRGSNKIVRFLFLFPEKSSARLGGHVARVASVAWSPDSRHIASGGVDRYLIVWTLSKPQDRKIIRGKPLKAPRSLKGTGGVFESLCI